MLDNCKNLSFYKLLLIITAVVKQVIKTLELENFADSLVGSDEEGGLSFEQKKRVSIAVELAASPSVIFLDEVSSKICPKLMVEHLHAANITLRRLYFPSFAPFSQQVGLTQEVHFLL